MKKNIITKSLLLGAAVGMLAQSSYATITYTSAGTTVGGAPVSATADISISGTTMTVKLTDLYADPASVGSVLNGITVNVAGATGAINLAANAANTVDLSSGSPVYGSATGATVASEFTLSSAGSAITLSSLGATGPDYLIIGPAGYGSANGSIQSGPHNPFILQTATFFFTLTGAGSFSESNLGALTFLFGTSSDSSTSTHTSVPEPSTVVAGALLLLPLGFSAVRVLRKGRVTA